MILHNLHVSLIANEWHMLEPFALMNVLDCAENKMIIKLCAIVRVCMNFICYHEIVNLNVVALILYRFQVQRKRRYTFVDLFLCIYYLFNQISATSYLPKRFLFSDYQISWLKHLLAWIAYQLFVYLCHNLFEENFNVDDQAISEFNLFVAL